MKYASNEKMFLTKEGSHPLQGGREPQFLIADSNRSSKIKIYWAGQTFFIPDR